MFSRFSSDLKGCRQVAIGASLIRSPPTEHDYLETRLEHWKGGFLWWAWMRPLEWTHCSKWQQCVGMGMFQHVWKCRASPAQFSWDSNPRCARSWTVWVALTSCDSPYTIRKFITTPHQHDYSRAETHHTAGATPRVYGWKRLRLLCCRHRSLPPAWSGIWIRLRLWIQYRLVSRSWSGRIACLVRLLNVTGGFTPSLSIL